MAYQWYVEPRDDFTNEFIARQLQAEDAQRSLRCKDGKKRNLWACSFELITTIDCVKNVQLKFMVFKKKLPHGAIVLFDPKLFSKKRKLKKAIEKELAKKHPNRS